MLFSVFFVLLFGCLVSAKNEEYMGYKVYNIELETKYHEDNWRLLKSDLIDFWRKPCYKYGVVGKAMVPPSHFNWFEEKLNELGITRDVYIENVYEYLLQEENKLGNARNYNIDDAEIIFDIKRYHRYDDIQTYLRSLAEKYANTTTRIELLQYGVTEQNRPLVYLKVGRNKTTDLDVDRVKPAVIVEAGINPREWITIQAVLNVLENVLKEDNLKFLEHLDWIIVPVVNPDGYEYTHTNLRLWTKSRSTSSHLGVICPGVNINRNFDVDWLHFDSSSSPCSHLFSGTEPFSEIETQMIKKIIEDNKSKTKLYISLQNNGGFISYPWNYERAASGMFRQHHLLALDMVKSMNESYNLDVGSVIFDRASGTSGDYARSSNILYTYNIDIVHRDDSVVIPEEDISEIVDDVWKAVAVAAEEMIKMNY